MMDQINYSLWVSLLTVRCKKKAEYFAVTSLIWPPPSSITFRLVPVVTALERLNSTSISICFYMVARSHTRDKEDERRRYFLTVNPRIQRENKKSRDDRKHDNSGGTSSCFSSRVRPRDVAGTRTHLKSQRSDKRHSSGSSHRIRARLASDPKNR